ncbi:DUF2796 domain-containing protein [Halopseudomonas sp.]|uniref:DUF2796 domain-containing protein n=1 Tax=Halopseudomonas sp. TaxID=2901191 RepID=UPI00356536EB
MRPTSLLLGGLLSTLAFAIQAHEHGHEDQHHSSTAHERAEKYHHDHGHSEKGNVSLAAHEHGVATLNLVLDGEHLVFELESPAANIVGFEHMPASEKDLATAKQARQRLTKADALFAFPGAAACTLEDAEVESPLFAAAKEQSHDHDEAHRNDHHKAHEEHHDHAQDDHAEHESAHSDIHAHFRFVCENPGALQQIEVKLFEVFPYTEKLLLQAITPNGQQGGELTPAQSVIRL